MVTGLDMRLLGEGLPRRQGGHRQRRRMYVVEAGWLGGHIASPDCDVLGSGTVAVEWDHPIHFLADRDVRHAVPHGLDDARELV